MANGAVPPWEGKMKNTALLLCLGGAVVVSAATPDCNRACLKTVLDQYLNAVVKHDPSAAPLFPGFRQTENAVVVRAGAGLWQSVTGLGKLQRRYMDTERGQAGYFGLIEEKNGLAIVTLRVRVLQRRVSEAEWLVARKGDPGTNGPAAAGQPAGNFFDPENLIANPPPDSPLPKADRLPREALIAIANSYFDGLSTHDGAVVLSHTGCSRIENGFTVTGRPMQNDPSTRTDCASNLQQFNVQYVAARRYPVVDEEAGVVLGMGVFIRRPGTPQRRNVLSEWFAIDHGKIRSIHAAMFYPPPDAPVPNWPPYNGNWPLPPTWGADLR
jgi:hypothetical protein